MVTGKQLSCYWAPFNPKHQQVKINAVLYFRVGLYSLGLYDGQENESK